MNPRPRADVIDTSASFATTGSEPILRAAMEYPPALVDDSREVPMSLTASDGTGLALTRLEARAVIDGPLAFTELRMSFSNPKDRVIEGRFSITLPEGAAISRLAMRIDGGWQEAEVVEKMAARRAYEDALHRRQDPALMEKEAGNAFRARIFPIPANGVKDIIISYSHELVGSESEYVLPLRGLPEIKSLSVNALVSTAERKPERVTLNEKGWVPDRDFRVTPKRAVAGLMSGDLVMVRARPKVNVDNQPIADLVVLFDTSASRALGFSGEVKRLGELVKLLSETHPQANLTVAAYDQTVSPIYDGPIGKFGDTQLDAILARRPLGASNLGAALAWTKGRANGRVIIVSDGIATAGSAERNQLRTLAKDIGARRIDAIVKGGIRDEAVMQTIARGNSKVDGVVLDGGLASSELAGRISKATVSGLKVKIGGAQWVWPETLDGVQPGDEFLIYARVPKLEGSKVALTTGAENMTAELEPTLEPLLRRAAVKADIARLEHMQSKANAKVRGEIRQEIVDMSTRERVLSDYTALLVLETEADYARFNIDRRALANILTVGDNGLDVVRRDQAVVANVPPPRPERGDGDVPGKRKDGLKADDSKDKQKAEAKKRPETKSVATEQEVEITGRVAKPKVAVNAPPPAEPEPSADNDADGIVDRDDRDDSDDAGDEEFEADAVEGSLEQPQRVHRLRGASVDARARVQAEQPGPNNETSELERELLDSPKPYTGPMAAVQKDLDARKIDSAVVRALKWRTEEPGDVMALIALGESLELRGNFVLAARAYGSIIDLFPSRADLRRFAAARLQRLDDSGIDLAVDSLEKAVDQRKDHLTGHRLLAYARVRKGDLAGAFEALESGLKQDYPENRFAGGKRILSEDLGVVGAAWVAANPKARKDVERRLAAVGSKLATEPSLRFVLNWETDANDVDFHILDGHGGHASYREKQLKSGGELFADVTTGYGPECFRIAGEPDAFPYRFLIHYYSRGPMGYGMGQVEVLQHDGKGQLRLDTRPFVVMNDQAWIELGKVEAPLK